MNHDFCIGCDFKSDLPRCAIGSAPSNAYIEDIINNNILAMSENFICHKAAQDLSNGKLSILSACDECGFCQIACPNFSIDYTTIFSTKLEKVIFNDFGKASILFKSIVPDSIVATEVQVKGNFRTKRIDLVIKKGSDLYIIKLLKTTDKIPFYMRSYDEVIEQYKSVFSHITFHSLCLVPADKKNDTIRINADIKDLSSLITLLGGINNGSIT